MRDPGQQKNGLLGFGLVCRTRIYHPCRKVCWRGEEGRVLETSSCRCKDGCHCLPQEEWTIFLNRVVHGQILFLDAPSIIFKVFVFVLSRRFLFFFCFCRGAGVLKVIPSILIPAYSLDPGYYSALLFVVL